MGQGHRRRLHYGLRQSRAQQGHASADTEVEAIAQALPHAAGPVTILTDSETGNFFFWGGGIINRI